jgi:hypothetical protein
VRSLVLLLMFKNPKIQVAVLREAAFDAKCVYRIVVVAEFVATCIILNSWVLN